MDAPAPVDLELIRAARDRIAPYVRHTPLEPSPTLEERWGVRVSLKLECLQVTGSFKPRLSFNKLLASIPEARARGAVASTAGGHGIGLAYAARTLGLSADLFLPRHADARKLQVMRRLGATLHLHDDMRQARDAAVRFAAGEGKLLVPPYNDPQVIAAGGTVGLEIAQDAPDVDLVIAGVGGGGLVSGIGVALAGGARVWGIQPENGPVLARWMEAGKPVPVDTRRSIADGLGAMPEEDTLTFPLMRRHVERMLLVSEEEIRAAMAWLLQEHQFVVEPSGAAPIAALLREPPRGARHVVVVLTGRNIAAPRYLELIAPAEVHPS
jgi:threonine dehydratase